jgi:hypothetical protein
MALSQNFRDAATKIAGKDSEHLSRFHSRRGEVCHAADLFSIPVLAWQRLTRTAKKSPWMAPAAVRGLNQLLRPDDLLLELGSGASTAWYAERVRRVVSLEPNIAWAERVRSELRNLPNAEVRVGTIEDLFVSTLLEIAPTVLIVDHSDEPRLSRTDAIRLALNNGEPPRLIVLDDSDRMRYRLAGEILLGGWSANRFTGFLDKPLRLTETTVYTRATQHQ